MNRRWLTLAILLPLVALALFFGCNGVARHHGTDGACRPLPTPQSATAACLSCPVLSDAATTTAREPLPDIGTPQHTRRHEAFCPDSNPVAGGLHKPSARLCPAPFFNRPLLRAFGSRLSTPSVQDQAGARCLPDDAYRPPDLSGLRLAPAFRRTQPMLPRRGARCPHPLVRKTRFLLPDCRRRRHGPPRGGQLSGKDDSL